MDGLRGKFKGKEGIFGRERGSSSLQKELGEAKFDYTDHQKAQQVLNNL